MTSQPSNCDLSVRKVTPSLAGVATYYLTTPIYYVNDAPHVGHAYTTLIADAIARWRRLRGEDVFFLTGTDEHGLKIQQAAEANGVTPREWADRTVERYRDAWRLLDISYDQFIRTTEPGHYAAVTKLLQACYDAGDIELDTYRGWYSVSDEAYIGADEVEDYRSRGRKVIELEEENYFFRLSRFQDRLLQWYEDHPDVIHPRLLDQPHVAGMGRAHPLGRAPRHLRLVRRADQLHHRGRLRAARRG